MSVSQGRERGREGGREERTYLVLHAQLLNHRSDSKSLRVHAMPPTPKLRGALLVKPVEPTRGDLGDAVTLHHQLNLKRGEGGREGGREGRRGKSVVRLSVIGGGEGGREGGRAYLGVVGKHGCELIAQGNQANQLQTTLLVQDDDAQLVPGLQFRLPQAHRKLGKQGLSQHVQRLAGRGQENSDWRTGG